MSWEKCTFCRLKFEDGPEISSKVGDLSQRMQDFSYLESLVSDFKAELKEMLDRESVDKEAVFQMEEKIRDKQLCCQRISTELSQHQMRLVTQAVSLQRDRSLLLSLRQKKDALTAQKRLLTSLEGCSTTLFHHLSTGLEERRWLNALQLFKCFTIEITGLEGTSAATAEKAPVTPAPPAPPAATAATATGAAATAAATAAARLIRLTGIGSIQGLPLLNSGIYTQMPSEATAAALARIGHLVDSLSVVLNIPLLHPVRPFSAVNCFISPQGDNSRNYALSPTIDLSVDVEPMRADAQHNYSSSSGSSSSSSSSIYSHESAFPSFRQFNRQPTQTSTVRETIKNPDFAFALQLLRVDVMALCLTSGVAPAKLFPAEAILPNLKVLEELCMEKCAAVSTRSKSGASIVTSTAAATAATTAAAATTSATTDAPSPSDVAVTTVPLFHRIANDLISSQPSSRSSSLGSDEHDWVDGTMGPKTGPPQQRDDWNSHKLIALLWARYGFAEGDRDGGRSGGSGRGSGSETGVHSIKAGRGRGRGGGGGSIRDQSWVPVAAPSPSRRANDTGGPAGDLAVLLPRTSSQEEEEWNIVEVKTKT